MKKVAVNLGRIIVLASIVWMLHNYYSNWHYHRLPNGVLVVHAHPFSTGTHSKAPFPVDDHKHETSHLLMMDAGQIVFIFSAFVLAIGLYFVIKKQKQLIQLVVHPKAFYGKYFHLRAPPLWF